MTPIALLNEWMDNEKKLGSPFHNGGVLASSTTSSIPRSRVVEIKEVDERGALFFTQKNSRKVKDFSENARASLTFWLPLQKKQANLEGSIIKLDLSDVEEYWLRIPRHFQLKFSAYGPLTGQPIADHKVLTTRYTAIDNEYPHEIPRPDDYVGYRLVPHVYFFYELSIENFSKCQRFTLSNSVWIEELLSP